jgi:hypothetical protein
MQQTTSQTQKDEEGADSTATSERNDYIVLAVNFIPTVLVRCKKA